jgi:hypothetical protein
VNPRAITDADLAYWADLDPHPATFTGPGEVEAGVKPCEALVTRDSHGDEFGDVVRVPWQPTEIELAMLARGGTIWLSTWGGLPMHMLEVVGPR